MIVGSCIEWACIVAPAGKIAIFDSAVAPNVADASDSVVKQVFVYPIGYRAD